MPNQIKHHLKILGIFVAAIIFVAAVLILLAVNRDGSKNADTGNISNLNNQPGDQIFLPGEIINETILQEPYPVQWSGWNGAIIRPTDVSLKRFTETENELVITFKINSGHGGYCSQSLRNSLRIASPNLDLYAPRASSQECINGSSTLTGQKAIFTVPSSQRDFTIKGGVGQAENQLKDLFQISVPEIGNIYVVSLVNQIPGLPPLPSFPGAPLIQNINLRLLNPQKNKPYCLGEKLIIQWESKGIDIVSLQLVGDGFYDIGRFPATFNEQTTQGNGYLEWTIGGNFYKYQGGVKNEFPIEESYGNSIVINAISYIIKDPATLPPSGIGITYDTIGPFSFIDCRG